MALLTGERDSDIIKLLGRWKRDTMMDYLHETSLSVFQRLAVTMFNNGHHTFLPTDTVLVNYSRLKLSLPSFYSHSTLCLTYGAGLVRRSKTLMVRPGEEKLWRSSSTLAINIFGSRQSESPKSFSWLSPTIKIWLATNQ